MGEPLHIPGDKWIRPRFSEVSDWDDHAVWVALNNGLKNPNCTVRGRAIPGFASITLPPDERTLWSPQLTLMYEPAEDPQKSLIRGLFGPAPGIWTFFMFLYIGLGFIGMCLLIYGLVLRTLGEDANVLWMVPLCLAAIMGLWIVARTGQRLARHQMHVLRDFTTQTLSLKLE